MKPSIIICMGSSCFARGNKENLNIIEKYLKENELIDKIDIDFDFSCSLCNNHCSIGPNIVVNGKEYNYMTSGKIYEILNEILKKERD
jgi:NADH:ubiquinone oxidoreductase subunit E